MPHDPNFYSAIAERGGNYAASLRDDHPLSAFAQDWEAEQGYRYLAATMSPGDDKRFIYLLSDDLREVTAFASRAPFAGLRYWETFVTPDTFAELARLRPVAGLRFAP